jgi:hypothetical protein
MKACPYRKDFYGKLGPPTPSLLSLSPYAHGLQRLLTSLEPLGVVALLVERLT